MSQIIHNLKLVNFIYLYIFLMLWNFTNGQMGILSIILILWWLVEGKRKYYFHKLKEIFLFKPLLILLLFFAYSYLSLLWAANIDSAMDTVLRFYKYYWIMIIVLFTVLSSKEAEKGLYIFIISLGVYSLFSILIYLNIVTLPYSDSSDPKGILAYAIVTPYMAIGFLSAVFMSIYTTNKSMKKLFFFFTITFFVALFINNGRAGQIAFFITLGVYAIVYRKYLLQNYKILLSGIFLIIFSIFLLFSFGKLDRLTDSFQEFSNIKEKQFDGSWGARAYAWYAAGDILKENYLVGVGAGDNIDQFVVYTKTHPSKATWIRTYHNQHLDTLTRFGIIGYLLLWSSVLFLLISLKSDTLYFSIGIAFFSITYFDGIGDIILLMKPYNTVFMLMFLLLSIISLKRTKPQSNKVTI